MTSKVTFSLEEDTLLAECVSKHPCLFDLKHPAYKDQQVRENVWKEICVILKTKSGKSFYIILYYIFYIIL